MKTTGDDIHLLVAALLSPACSIGEIARRHSNEMPSPKMTRAEKQWNTGDLTMQNDRKWLGAQ